MISLRNTQQNAETRASNRAGTEKATGRTSGKETGRAKQTVAANPFTVDMTKAAKQTDAVKTAPAADNSIKTTTPSGGVDLSMFTTVAIDRQASVAYSKAAEAKNYEIDFLYKQARDNWELNGRRGPEPVKPQYHETQSEKIFSHLQSFRFGDVAIPSDGSGYLSTDGYMSASPHQQRYGMASEQLTAYAGNGYQQSKMPVNPATPNNADVLWGRATESLKSKA